MKKTILIIITGFFFYSGYTQQKTSETEPEKELSKIDQFTSKTGSLLRFEDYSLDDLALLYGGRAEAKVRKITSEGKTGYFFQIINEGKYGSKSTSIAYEDLLELLKALKVLKVESVQDLSRNLEYLENKFVTDDGFQLGYFVSKGKLQWYIVLEKYGSNNTIFIKEIGNTEVVFNTAKTKIETFK